MSSVVRDDLVPARAAPPAHAGSTSSTARRSGARRRHVSRSCSTVHDLADPPLSGRVPRWHRLYGQTGLRRTLEAADAVVAVSESRRPRPSRSTGSPAERIRVVPNGVDDVFTHGGPAVGGDYVLAVATLEPRKNLVRAVEAARARRRRSCESSERGAGAASMSRAGWARCRTRARGARTAARAASSTRRCTRASVFPFSRRWRAGRLS